MRDYEDVARSVLRRRDEQLAKDKHRRVMLIRTGTAALSFCFACAVGIGAWKSGTPQWLMDQGKPGGSGLIAEETGTSPMQEVTEDITPAEQPSSEAAVAEKTTEASVRTTDDTAVRTSENKTVKTEAAGAETTSAPSMVTAAVQTAKAETGAAVKVTTVRAAEQATAAVQPTTVQVQPATAAAQPTAPAAVKTTSTAAVKTTPAAVQATTPVTERATRPAEVPTTAGGHMPADSIGDDEDHRSDEPVSPIGGDEPHQSDNPVSPIGNDDHDDNIGRDAYQKRVTSFFATIMTASSEGSQGINEFRKREEAKDNPYIAGALNYSSNYSYCTDDPFAQINEGIIDVDFNDDGIVNEWDSYLMFWYTWYVSDDLPEAVRTNITKYGDLNKDGLIDRDDCELLMQYVVIYTVPSEQMYQSEYYYDMTVSCVENGMTDYSALLEDQYSFSEALFVDNLYNCSERLGVTYYVFADKVDKGEINLDFDGDDTFSLRDIIWCKIYEQVTPFHTYTDPATGREVTRYDQSKKIETDPATRKRIEAIRTVRKSMIDERRTAGGYIVGGKLSDVIRYYFESHELTAKMLNNGYYDALIKGAADYDIARDIMWYQYFTDKISDERFDEYLIGDAYQGDLVEAITEKEIEQMYAGIGNGTLPLPDTDRNGVIDVIDYRNCDTYNGDRVSGRTSSESTLHPGVYAFFASELDYDSDGKFGGDTDIMLAKKYILECVTESIRERMISENGNVDEDALSWCRAALEFDWYDKEEAYRWGIYDGLDMEMLPDIIGSKTDAELEAYKTAVVAGTAEEPDLDGDGEITYNDLQIASAMKWHLESINAVACGRSPEATELDPEVFTEELLARITSSCDFNSDGRSGMMYDMAAAEKYIDEILTKQTMAEYGIQYDEPYADDTESDEDEDVIVLSREKYELLAENDEIPEGVRIIIED